MTEKIKKPPNKEHLLLITPMLIAIDLAAITLITSLISQPNDIALYVGLITGLATIISNYFIIKFLYKRYTN